MIRSASSAWPGSGCNSNRDATGLHFLLLDVNLHERCDERGKSPRGRKCIDRTFVPVVPSIDVCTVLEKQASYF